ncbi:MAG: glycosyltransferase [Williamsia sp.]|nr:glycosyltransferase [Williamsia sp.]
MVICIDRFLSDQYLSGYSLLIEDLMEELARRNSMHRFIWLTAAPPVAGISLAPNITIYPINSLILKLLGKKAWYRIALPRLLKKLQADRFVSTGNLSVPAGPVPCFLFLPAVPPLTPPDKDSRPLANLLKTSSRLVHKIVVSSAVDKQRIAEGYPAAAGKTIHLQLAAIQPTGPFSVEEREAAKTRFAAGLEYFVFAGDLQEEHLLTELLKAFSLFKKWQRSNMQLVIAGNTTARTDSWLQTLSSYKYRKDVHILQDPPKPVLLAAIAGAYAFVYPARHDHVPVNICYAMHAGVPVVTSRIPVIEETAGQAALYAVSNNETGFSAAMQTLYKDERLRDSLIQKGYRLLAEKGTDMVKDCWTILETC